MSKRSIFELLDGYTHTESGVGKHFLSVSITGSFAGRGSSRALRTLFAFTARLKSIFSYTSTRCYGLFFLTFGLATLFIHFAKDYLGVYDSVPLPILIVGAITAIVGVLVVVFDKPLTVFLQDFKLTDFILYEFFCIKRSYKRTDVRGIPSFVGLIVGILLASVGGVLPFDAVVPSTVGIVYCYIAFLSPEFSLFSTFLVLPYLSYIEGHELILSAFVLLNAISFARKVMLGKRVFHLEQYDVCLFIFLAFVLVSGIFVKGMESFISSLVMIVLALGYTLSSCIIANRRLADCLINALISSSIPVSIIAAVQFIKFLISSPVSSFSGVSATFSSPSVLAVFLLLSYVFSLYMLRVRHARLGHTVYVLIAALTFGALVLTANIFAIAVALLVPPLYLLLRGIRPFIIVLIPLAVLPSLVIFIPTSVLSSLSDISWLSSFKIGELAVQWSYAKEMLLNNLFTGIGIGGDCFALELSQMTGTDAIFNNAGSLMLGIAASAGVFALVAFVMILFIRVRHTKVYLSYARNSRVSHLSPFNTLALSALLLFGTVNYLWADMSMYFLFWCVFGIGTATLRLSRQEHDDRMGYYSDGRSADASSIDVEIK